jgi:hypothetical protein
VPLSEAGQHERMVFCVDANGIDHDYGVLLWCFASELLKLLHAIIAFVGRSESILGGSGVGAQTFPGLGWTAMDSWKSSKLSSNLSRRKIPKVWNPHHQSAARAESRRWSPARKCLIRC